MQLGLGVVFTGFIKVGSHKKPYYAESTYILECFGVVVRKRVVTFHVDGMKNADNIILALSAVSCEIILLMSV